MRSFWIVLGSQRNWSEAFKARGIWGLRDTAHDKVYWLAVAPEDVLLFYVTGRVKGVIGYGTVRNRFYQDLPLWSDEVREGRAEWPLRFEFDVDFLLPEDRWKDEKVPVPGGGQFRQPLILKGLGEVEPIIRSLNPAVSPELLRGPSLATAAAAPEPSSPSHDQVRELLLEIGKLQGYVADREFQMGTERLDAVWRRLPESVPTYAFEVHVGGDLYHAVGKLKHAHDIWNSRIFLVAPPSARTDVNRLLSGTFHEIARWLRLIETEKVASLHASKRNIQQIERDLGLLP